MSTNAWALKLFRHSPLKQQKWQAIVSQLGETEGMRCLDIGADSGVVSYLLRRQGGIWKSADLDTHTVQAIRTFVGQEVYQIDGENLPFEDEEFDRVVIVDFLEHIHTDRQFIGELFRIMRPGGELIINVPNLKQSFLRRFRLWIGQTDERHGHVRPGYSLNSLRNLLRDHFTITEARTYSRFFSEAIDTVIRWATELMKKEKSPSRKGTVLTDDDLRKHSTVFMLYGLIYPVVWAISRLDQLLFWTSGYMLIAKATSNKPLRESFREGACLSEVLSS